MNILICLNSGKHISYVSSLFQILSENHKLFINCYKDKKDKDYLQYIKNFNIKEIEFIIDTSFLSKFMRNYDEVLSLCKFLQHDDVYYSKRFSQFGSSIQKKILSKKILKKILTFCFKLKFLEFLRIIFLIFLNYNNDIINQFKNNQINHCIVTPGNHKDSVEIEYIRIAKKLNLKSSAIVRSWDVLTTKSIFRYKPDTFFCWNNFHEESLKKYHSIESNIKKSGSLFFEKWFDKRNLMKERNIDKNRIIYFGSSEKIVKHLDADIVIRFNNFLQKFNKKTGKNFDIVFRPHPANNLPIKKIISAGIKVDPEQANNLIVNDEDQITFVNNLKKCLFTIGVNTSAMIDSIILDIPTVALVVKNEKIIQFQSAHFRHIVDEGIVYQYQLLEENLESLFSKVKTDTLHYQRKNYVRNNIFIDDSKPSQLIANVLNEN